MPRPERAGRLGIRPVHSRYINKGVEAKCRDEVRKQIVGRLHEVACEAKAAGLTPSEVKEIVDAVNAGREVQRG